MKTYHNIFEGKSEADFMADIKKESDDRHKAFAYYLITHPSDFDIHDYLAEFIDAQDRYAGQGHDENVLMNLTQITTTVQILEMGGVGNKPCCQILASLLLNYSYALLLSDQSTRRLYLDLMNIVYDLRYRTFGFDYAGHFMVETTN